MKSLCYCCCEFVVDFTGADKNYSLICKCIFIFQETCWVPGNMFHLSMLTEKSQIFFFQDHVDYTKYLFTIFIYHGGYGGLIVHMTIRYTVFEEEYLLKKILATYIEETQANRKLFGG